MAKTTSILFVALIVIAGVATAENVSVDGQIFIVTKAQQAIKLALVRTSAVPEKSVLSLIEDHNASFEKNESLARTIEEKRIEIIKIKTELKNPNNSLEQFPFLEMEKLARDDCKQSEGSVKFLVCTPKQAEALKRKNYLYEQFKETFDKVEALRQEMKNLMLRHRIVVQSIRQSFYSNLFSLTPTDVAKSDVDGKFSLSALPNQRFAIIASSNRSIGDSTEYYQWAIWVKSQKGINKPTTLANDNLLETGCDECIRPSTMQLYPDESGPPEYINKGLLTDKHMQ